MREGRLRSGPETLQINLGNACNLNCIFCWNHSPIAAHQPSAAWHRQRLSDAHFDAVIAALPDLRPARVLLSGRGEPLLHPRAEELLAELRRLSIAVTVQTNGIAGPSPASLMALGVDRLFVNLSAAEADGYGRVHPGRAHLFERVRNRLLTLAELRPRGQPPHVDVVAIIHRENYPQLEKLAELTAVVAASRLVLKGMELGAGMERLLFTPTHRVAAWTALQQAKAAAVRFGVPLEAEHLEQILQAQGADGAFTPVDPVDGSGAVVQSADRVATTRRCYMGWYYLRVTCDGRVMFCCKDKQVGHLDERGLYSLWRSPSYHLHRLAAREGDGSTGLIDAKCSACSNFARNRAVHAIVAAEG